MRNEVASSSFNSKLGVFDIKDSCTVFKQAPASSCKWNSRDTRTSVYSATATKNKIDILKFKKKVIFGKPGVKKSKSPWTITIK